MLEVYKKREKRLHVSSFIHRTALELSKESPAVFIILLYFLFLFLFFNEGSDATLPGVKC